MTLHRFTPLTLYEDKLLAYLQIPLYPHDMFLDEPMSGNLFARVTILFLTNNTCVVYHAYSIQLSIDQFIFTCVLYSC